MDEIGTTADPSGNLGVLNDFDDFDNDQCSAIGLILLPQFFPWKISGSDVLIHFNCTVERSHKV